MYKSISSIFFVTTICAFFYVYGPTGFRLNSLNKKMQSRSRFFIDCSDQSHDHNALWKWRLVCSFLPVKCIMQNHYYYIWYNHHSLSNHKRGFFFIIIFTIHALLHYHTYHIVQKLIAEYCEFPHSYCLMSRALLFIWVGKGLF